MSAPGCRIRIYSYRITSGFSLVLPHPSMIHQSPRSQRLESLSYSTWLIPAHELLSHLSGLALAILFHKLGSCVMTLDICVLQYSTVRYVSYL